MKHICFSMHKSQDDPSSLDKKFHRLETIVVAAKTRPQTAFCFLLLEGTIGI
jgi:hypothetical protein